MPHDDPSADRAKRVLAALATLPDSLQRDVLRLRLFGEDGCIWSPEAIARRFCVSVASIRQAERAGVIALRALLGD